MRTPSCLLAALTIASLPAQVAPGSAVVLSNTGFSLVDKAGAAAPITGLNPQTAEAMALVIDAQGVLFAGLLADNTVGAAPLPLTIRRITLTGASATQDSTFATLLAVPPGESWAVMDLKVRADGGLLAACTRLLSSGSPASAAFLVSTAGVPTALATTSYPTGSLLGAADAGDRYVAVFYRTSPLAFLELVSFPYATGPAPFQVFSRAQTYGSGGIGIDADGSVIFVLPPPAGLIARIQHAYHGTAIPVTVPRNFAFGELVPAAGLVAGPDMLGNLLRVDTLTGAITSWGNPPLTSPRAIAVRRNPEVRSDPSAPVLKPTYFGSHGSHPFLGNAAFGLRVGGTPGASAYALLASQPASLPTSFGTLLVDPLGPLATLGPVPVPASGEARVALPIPTLPALVGGTVHAQAVLVTSTSPLVARVSQALAITIE